MTALSPVLAEHIEIWPLSRLTPYARNARTHSPEQVDQIAGSIVEFGFTQPILVDSNAGIIAGHGRAAAAGKLGLEEVPVIVLDHLSESQRRAYILADNKIALNAGWDRDVLAGELRGIEQGGFDLAVVGFTADELAGLLPSTEELEAAVAEEEQPLPEVPVTPVTQKGDIWRIGTHRLICGDCRDLNTIEILFRGYARAAVVITSPPYATQREYDPASGFQPIPEDEYLAWYCTVAHNIWPVLADDGSYFLNIKEHADGGQRSLYVKELVIAHVREWGWRFVDEFCWRKTNDGVPGGWNNRFKNAWEPVFHFCRQQQIKFRPDRVGHASEDCFDYSPLNPKARSGSGLLGCGPRGAAADGGKNQDAWQRSRGSLSDDNETRHSGIARPSNVLEVKAEGGQGSHSAPFPRALVDFFLQAFSDPGDVVLDPFLGSGTTMAAAHARDRIALGCEISPAYCDVIVRRMMAITGVAAELEETGLTFAGVAAARGVDVEQALNPKQLDSRAIKHTNGGTNPCYGPRRKAS